MSNLFINIPPVADNVGANVDVSAMGKRKTITVSGVFSGTLIIEVSLDAGASWIQALVFSKTGKKPLEIAAQLMRVRSEGAGAFTFTPNIDAGANDDGGNYGVIPLPSENAVGATLAISAFGGFTTLSVVGDFTGVIGIQISEDGVDFTEVATFQSPGTKNCKDLVGQQVRAESRGAIAGKTYAPVSAIGAIDDPSTAGSLGSEQVFRYTATGAEGSDFNVTLPAARANDVYAVFSSQADMAAIIGMRMPDAIAGDRTTTTFRVITTAALTLGDIIEFSVKDR